MSRKNVTYNAEHRAMATDRKCRLMTIDITHPGGKPYVLMQGPANEEETNRIFDFIKSLTESRHDKSKGKSA